MLRIFRLSVVICRHSAAPRKYSGPIGKCAVGVLTEGQLHHIHALTGDVNEASTVEAYYRARSEHDVFHSALYTRATKQNNYTVCYKTSMTSSLQFGEIYCFVCIKSFYEQKVVAIVTPFEKSHFHFTSSHDLNSYLEQRIIPIHRPAVRREEYIDICEISKCISIINLQGQRFVCVFANTLHSI